MAYKTIKLKKYVDIIEEYVATAVAIMPGALLELTSAGLVQAHATAGGNCLPMFALEDELQGNGIDTTYAASARVQVWVPVRGEIVYARLADGQNVAVGDFLESAGAGSLQKYTADPGESNPNLGSQIVGVAVEALNLTGSANLTAVGRIAVRIL